MQDRGRLVPPEPGFEIVAASVSVEQTVVAVWARAQDVPAFTSVTAAPGFATFPDSRTPTDVGAVVVAHDGGVPRPLVALHRLPLAHVTADLMPDGGVLLAGARAHWTEAGAERNGMVYDRDGRLVVEETLGDGLEHVQTTADGQVWVGYFDEGVFGNYGWGSPGPSPVGERGIVRFDRHLRSEWEFPSPSEQAWGAISDCYALNVGQDAVWACYYTDFPVVRIQGDVVTSWDNEVRGAKALVVAEERVALYGGYGDERHRLVLGSLVGGRLQVESVTAIRMSDGGPLPPEATVHGRGRWLHAVAGDRWEALDPFDARG